MCLRGCICTCVRSCVRMIIWIMYQWVGSVTTFGCGMYVELISCFHICGIIINASEWDLVHLFVGESKRGAQTHLAMWRFPRNLKCWRHSLKKRETQTYLGWRFARFYVFCKLTTQDKWSACDQTELQQLSLDADTNRKHRQLISCTVRRKGSSHWNYSLFFFSLSCCVITFICSLLATFFPFLLLSFSCPHPSSVSMFPFLSAHSIASQPKRSRGNTLHWRKKSTYSRMLKKSEISWWMARCQ